MANDACMMASIRANSVVVHREWLSLAIYAYWILKYPNGAMTDDHFWRSVISTVVAVTSCTRMDQLLSLLMDQVASVRILVPGNQPSAQTNS